MKDIFDKVSTVRLHESTKLKLEKLMLPQESYDDALYRVLSKLEQIIG
jgi:hypothetical protein